MSDDRVIALDRGWHAWRTAAVRSAGMPFAGLEPLAAEDLLAQPAGRARTNAVRAATRSAIDRLLCDDLMLAALTWQSPALVSNWVGDYAARLRAGDRPTLSRMDRRDALIARYAQRYCAKNDTIGFFGAVAWVRLAADRSDRSGSLGLRRSDVYFETWAIRALAEAWREDPKLREHLPARLDPSCSLVNGAILRPHRPDLRLTEPAIAIAHALSGGTRVGELLARFGEVADEVLQRLCAAGAAQVGFLVPIDSAPEAHLRASVADVPDAACRESLVAVLDRLDCARAAVAAAADPVELHDRLVGLEQCLAQACGGSAERTVGSASYGRTAVYLDCRRDLDVVIGGDLLDSLVAPLAVVLDSARWLVGQAGEVVADALRDRYRRLRSRRSEVTLADLQFASADLLDPGGDLLDEVVDDFQLRWAEILPSGTADARMPVAVARRQADELFPAGGRSWAAAHVHSPDLMLREVPAGAGRWVLGELHLALNTLESRVFRTQADDERELVEAVRATMPAGRVVPVYPASSPDVTSRTYPPLALDPPGAYRYWSYASDDGHPDGVRSTAATALVVEERAGDLFARARSGDWEAPVLECFGEFVTALVVNLFQIRRPAPYAPRVTLGDLVICRRTWRLPLSEVAHVPSLSEDPAHDVLRGWALRHGLPRRAFFRSGRQVKPVFLDFAAPALVEGLARAVRNGAPDGFVEITEMLPGPDELWLRDAAGQRYTSELRLVAVDPTPPATASWSLTEL